MEQIINVSELKQPQAETKSYSQTCLDSQSPTPVASQTGHDYSLVRTHTPESHHMPPPRHEGPMPSEVRKFANPAPLGLCGFALTAFLSNGMSVFAGVSVAGENVSSALAYGGIIQVLVGMWYVISNLREYMNAFRRTAVVLTRVGKWLLGTPSVPHPSVLTAHIGCHLHCSILTEPRSPAKLPTQSAKVRS